MPIYEYACTSCGERTEARQSFADPPLEDCADCGGKLRKLFSPVGIVFKGSGFYSTDAKGSKSKSSSEKTGDAPAKTDSKDATASKKESSTDSKPAATTGGGTEKSA